VAEIDSIIAQIQRDAQSIDDVHAQRTPAAADGKILQLLLRLAWEVKGLQTGEKP
jgi:hypothetical protein